VSSKKRNRCDACGRRIRDSHHELRLFDPATGQIVGKYHTRPECQTAATKYLSRGVVLLCTYLHPNRCGEDQEFCDGGLREGAT
jgi:hypothetical protein